jgi:hypothetical protein
VYLTYFEGNVKGALAAEEFFWVDKGQHLCKSY